LVKKLNLQIEKILKSKSIIEYLATRGHFPVKEISNGRYTFLCPFEDHKETKPSFIVYTKSEYENFYCFGCQRNFSIIDLVSFLDHISFSEALKRLDDGIVIPTEEEIKYIIDKIRKKISGNNPASDLNKILFQISWQCLQYSQGINFDLDEMKCIDRYYEFVDVNMMKNDFETIEESTKYLPINLQKRRKKFDQISQNKKQKELEEEII